MKQISKQLQFGDEARQNIKKGVDKLANAVASTLGPFGRNVILDRKHITPIISKDGVTVAEEIRLKDKFENIGVKLIREAASRTNESAGDGTTTSVVLARSIYNEGLKLIATGISPITIKKAINEIKEDIIVKLKAISKPISTKEEITQIASISANDKEIGKIISEIIDEIGKDGVITVEESPIVGLQKDIVKGIKFDKGYISPYMITDRQRMECIIEDTHIIVVDKKISYIDEIVPILKKLLEVNQKKLVIIAEDIDGQALATMIMNKLQGGFNVVGIKAPEFGEFQKENLKDIATITGAKIISDEVGNKIENVEINMLGKAKKVISNKDYTIIIEGEGKQEEINTRIYDVKKQLNEVKSKFDKERLNKRLGRLTGGVAVIKVGAPTEAETKELKYRIEDALCATKSAIEEGILPGGGIALLNAIDIFDIKKYKKIEKNNITDNKIYFASDIIKKAILESVKQLATNAGKDGSDVISEIKQQQIQNNNINIGYNVEKDIYEDMIVGGIIDPTKVVRLSLQNAISAATMLLTTECAITDDPEDEMMTKPEEIY